MGSVSSVIADAATQTAQMQAAQPRVTGAASSNLSSNQFLQLMLKQLQYQDPMAPTDNAQFVSQQCQFSQLSETQNMSANIANTNAAMQASSLVGENVTLYDPSATNETKTVTGTVTSALINGSNSAIQVNGKNYPLSYLITVNKTSAAGTETTTDTKTNASSSSSDSGSTTASQT